MTAESAQPFDANHHHNFDEEIAPIFQMSLDMMHLLTEQCSQISLALNNAEQKPALNIIEHAADIRTYEAEIDQAVIRLLAKQAPVAGDLRRLFALSKIALTQKYLGDELCDIAKSILTLYEKRNGQPNAQLTTEIAAITQNIQQLMTLKIGLLSQQEADTAHRFLQQGLLAGDNIQHAISAQMTLLQRNQSRIRPALALIQILKSLEACADHCKNLAEYCVYMIDGDDVRYTQPD
jgi:phosphate transport system protein